MGKNQLQEPSINNRCFYTAVALILILLASILARDISRPFFGLHSWGKAGTAWKARSYLKYDLDYSKGFAVWAVGDPPTKNPNRAADHPQLAFIAVAFDMALFGMNEAGYRTGAIIRALIALFIFICLVRSLMDSKTALLAGLLYALFPIIGYFGSANVSTLNWEFPLGLLALWCYLIIIKAVKTGTAPKKYHRWVLALALFFAIQINWEGTFFAAAIGIHYICHCLRHKKMLDKKLLALLIIAPATSLIINFTVMAAAHNWHWENIWQLYKWRAAKGEMQQFKWSAWLNRLCEFAVLNFSIPVLLIAVIYLTFGQLIAYTIPKSEKTKPICRKTFPQFWLLFMPALLQLLLLRGSLWKHQYWEAPLVPVIAIAAAIGILLIRDVLCLINKHLANTATVVLVALIFIFCTQGLNYYYSIRWQSPRKIKMFKDLNQMIPPDKALLSFEDFVVNQHPVKGPHYRPEIAWYLDREIVVAKTMEEITEKAAAGRYPYYLIPQVEQLMPLVRQLSQRYKYQYVPGHHGEITKDGKFLKAGMMSYFIFDLSSSAGRS